MTADCLPCARLALLSRVSLLMLLCFAEAPGAPCKSDEAIEPLPGPDGPAPAAAGFQGLQVIVPVFSLFEQTDGRI